MGSPSVVRRHNSMRGGSIAVESAAAFAWNGWQACYGINGSFRVERVAGLPWNQWQDSPGIGGSFTVEYANYLLVIAIGTLIAAIFAVIAWVCGRTLPRRIWHWLKRPRLRIPRETLRIYPTRRYPLMSDQRWHTAFVGDQPVMQIVSEWQVTNMAKEAIHIHRTRIVRPRKARTDGEAFVVDPQTNCVGDWFLAPRSTAQAITQFFVHPPVCLEGEDFKAKIVFTDQFGNVHKTKWIVFKYY